MARNDLFGIAFCLLLIANFISAVNYSSMQSIFFVSSGLLVLLIILMFLNPGSQGRSKRDIDALKAELKKLGFNQQVNQSPIQKLDFVAGDGKRDDFFVGVDNFQVVALRKSELDSVEINKQVLYFNNQYCVVEDLLYRQTPLRLYRK